MPFFHFLFFEIFFVIMGKKNLPQKYKIIYLKKKVILFLKSATLCSGNVFADNNAIDFIAVWCIMKFVNNFLCIKMKLLEIAVACIYKAESKLPGIVGRHLHSDEASTIQNHVNLNTVCVWPKLSYVFAACA